MGLEAGLVILQLTKTSSNVSIVISSDTLRSIVGISMDIPKSNLHIRFNEVFLVMVEMIVIKAAGLVHIL